MGWIKAHLDEETHDALRKAVDESDKPTHELAAELVKRGLRSNGCENHGH